MGGRAMPRQSFLQDYCKGELCVEAGSRSPRNKRCSFGVCLECCFEACKKAAPLRRAGFRHCPITRHNQNIIDWLNAQNSQKTATESSPEPSTLSGAQSRNESMHVEVPPKLPAKPAVPAPAAATTSGSTALSDLSTKLKSIIAPPPSPKLPSHPLPVQMTSNKTNDAEKDPNQASDHLVTSRRVLLIYFKASAHKPYARIIEHPDLTFAFRDAPAAVCKFMNLGTDLEESEIEVYNAKADRWLVHDLSFQFPLSDDSETTLLCRDWETGISHAMQNEVEKLKAAVTRASQPVIKDARKRPRPVDNSEQMDPSMQKSKHRKSSNTEHGNSADSVMRGARGDLQRASTNIKPFIKIEPVIEILSDDD